MLVKRIQKLFDLCHRLRGSYVALQGGFHTLQETGMNASVAVGHTGSHQKSFAEIAVQINRTITRMDPLLKAAESHVNNSIQKILRAFILQRNYSKYAKAYRMMPANVNRRRVGEVMGQWVYEIYDLLVQMLPLFHQIEALSRSMRQQHNLLFALTNILKIEATALQGEDCFNIIALAETLERDLNTESQKMEELAMNLDEVRKTAWRLVMELAERGELLYAKVYAA